MSSVVPGCIFLLAVAPCAAFADEDSLPEPTELSRLVLEAGQDAVVAGKALTVGSAIASGPGSGAD